MIQAIASLPSSLKEIKNPNHKPNWKCELTTCKVHDYGNKCSDSN